MKKLLALILALVLACSLCVPALAAEEKDAVELMEELGLLDEVGGYGFTVDGDLLEEYGVDTQPKLTLVVNGVASDVAITAGEGVTYADAAALRGILSAKAVAPTYEGPVPVREAAQNAGWDVEWYDGGWEGLDRQVCLWNKDAFVAEIKDRTQPFQTLWDAAVELSQNTLFTETPQRATQTATVTFKRFDSLDGDKTYTLKLRAESVWHKGVVDCAVTFDVSQLLGMLTAAELEGAAKDAGLSPADFRNLFSAGKAEFIIDYNAGGMAYHIPLLGLLDEEMEGWQGTYFPGLTQAIDPEGGLDLAGSLYENMLDAASRQGGVAAREETEGILASLGVFAGADSVRTAGSTVTWTLETDKVNAALSKLVGDGTGAFSLFKKCDVDLTFNTQGKTDLTLALRLDTDGILEAVMAGEDELDVIVRALLNWLVGGADMELTAAANSDQGESSETMKLHIKNFGVIDVNTQSTAKSTAQTPRQLAQVEREWVKGETDGGDKS